MILQGMGLEGIGIDGISRFYFHGFFLRGEKKGPFKHKHHLFIGVFVHGNLSARFQDKIAEGKIVVIFLSACLGVHHPANLAPLHGDLLPMTGNLFDFNFFNVFHISYDHGNLLKIFSTLTLFKFWNLSYHGKNENCA